MFTAKSRLRKRKQFALFEVEQDLRYIEAFKNGQLRLDETSARKRLGELTRKENRSDKENQERSNLMDIVSLSTAVKKEYEDLTKLRAELKEYISLL